MDAARRLESFVGLLGPLGNRASACLAEWMAAGRAERPKIRGGCETHVAYSCALRIEAGISIKLG